MDNYKTVKSFAHDELTEKRSRFIGYCKPVGTEEEAVEFINKIKKEHWDARHNVYAYSLREGQVMRYSDDGEPSGTAGVPVLDVIRKSGITDVVIVVTRYFGGVLLGTGGLVRAYSAAAKLGLEAAGIVDMCLCSECEFSCTYNQYGKLNTLIIDKGGAVDNCDFADNVIISFHIPADSVAQLQKEFADATAGEVEIEMKSEKFFEI